MIENIHGTRSFLKGKKYQQICTVGTGYKVTAYKVTSAIK